MVQYNTTYSLSNNVQEFLFTVFDIRTIFALRTVCTFICISALFNECSFMIHISDNFRPCNL